VCREYTGAGKQTNLYKNRLTPWKDSKPQETTDFLEVKTLDDKKPSEEG